MLLSSFLYVCVCARVTLLFVHCHCFVCLFVYAKFAVLVQFAAVVPHKLLTFETS